MSVRYKFKSEATFSQIHFDGIEISVGDIKKEIFRRRKLGKSENIDLMISNTETGEKYTTDDTLVRKNSSLTVIRVPVTNTLTKSRKYFNKRDSDATQNLPQTIKSHQTQVDLTRMNGTEEEKIAAMMVQSAADYGNFLSTAKPPATYVCRKCHIPGHFIRNCPLGTAKSYRFNPKERRENKRMTGIPMSMRNQQENPPTVNVTVKIAEVPQRLCCTLCRDIFRSPVTTPCCDTLFCNECIVRSLLESDEYECPKCAHKYIFPSELRSDDNARREVESVRGGRKNQVIVV